MCACACVSAHVYVCARVTHASARAYTHRVLRAGACALFFIFRLSILIIDYGLSFLLERVQDVWMRLSSLCGDNLECSGDSPVMLDTLPIVLEKFH